MGRQLQKLSAKTVANLRRGGYWGDGGGLYLQISPSRSKSWIFRYTLKGKSREMGLGSLNAVGLAEARKRAEACRLMLVDGIDPIETRRARGAQDALAKAKAVSFQKCADGYISAHRAGWRNAKHADQWKTTLETFAYPIIGALPVQAVDTALVLRVIEPIWSTKSETASRVRGRIESVLDWASARGYRSGDNPARWRGHLAQLLPSLTKELHVQHHAALPYDQIGKFMVDLRNLDGTAARALELAILTTARTGEVIGAQPEEFDVDKALWIIPAARMKGGREHRVPLSRRAVEIVRAQIKPGSVYVFQGRKEGKPLSADALPSVLKRMARTGLTVHGFRSTFRDWAAETTAYPHEVCEMALAHAVGDKVEAAYRRGDLFEKRRRLAADWAKYCEQPAKAGKVTPIRAKAS